ncbi:MAG TPA: hypothetical protein P5032_19005 [Candidatus Competibacter sp.]|nr:hypothetical protein [Candidatus Competibacter sp.]
MHDLLCRRATTRAASLKVIKKFLIILYAWLAAPAILNGKAIEG